MQERNYVSNGVFNGESMESQPLEKAVSSLFCATQTTFVTQPVYKQKTDNRLIISLLTGAENGTRTRDLNLGKVALYQLSYFRKLHIISGLHVLI